MTKRKAELDLTFLTNYISPSYLPPASFTSDLVTYGYPQKKIPAKVIAQVKAYAENWSPSLLFWRAFGDDLDEIENFNFLSYYNVKNWSLYCAKFSAIDTKRQTIIKFKLLIGIHCKNQDTSLTDKRLTFDQYSHLIYWARVKQEPIKNYSQVLKILRNAQWFNKGWKKKIEKLEAKITRLNNKHRRTSALQQQLNKNFNSSVLDKSLEQCLSLAQDRGEDIPIDYHLE